MSEPPYPARYPPKEQAIRSDMDIDKAKIVNELDDIMYKLNLKHTLIQPDDILILSEELPEYVVKKTTAGAKQARIDTLQEIKEADKKLNGSQHTEDNQYLILQYIDSELEKLRSES